MAERNLDFDTVIERRNTSCLKYDFAKKRGMPEDVMPLWVADMDFKISSYIEDALAAQAAHGIYGYTETTDAYFEAVHDWILRHHGWEVSDRWLVKTPGIVYALAMAVQAFTDKGDGVMIQQPVYYPFSGVIRGNGRRVISNSLVYDGNGGYTIDFADFEEKIVREKIRLFILCNPHNPVGRVWNRDELERLGDLCEKHEVIVVSDEIHADFVWEKKHLVLANLKESYQNFVITATSPSKTFNIAGLQASNLFVPNPELRKKMLQAIDASGYSQLNAAGVIAAEAAYRYGEEWYQAMKVYVKSNLAYTAQYLRENLPQLKMIEPEGTYLVWIDCRGLGLSNQQLEDLVIHKAGLWLDSGIIFGDDGRGFQRINVACPRATLKLALDKLKAAVDTL